MKSTQTSQSPLATIVIPTAGDRASLQATLKSLESQTLKSFDILIVTHNKSFFSNPITISIPHKIILQKGSGLVQAMNTALDNVTTPFFIRVDDDVVMHPQWFEEMLAPFADSQVGGVTGPTIIPKAQRKNRDLFAFLEVIQNSYNPIHIMLQKLYLDYIYEGKIQYVSTFLKSGAFTLGSNYEESQHINAYQNVTNLEACNFAVRTSLLHSLKGFDTVFARGLSEYHEADIAFKIQKAGFQLMFNPKATLHHSVQASTSPTRPDAQNRIKNFIIFCRRHILDGTFPTLAKVATNVVLQNMYYTHKAITTHDLSQLRSWLGTVQGIRYNDST